MEFSVFVFQWPIPDDHSIYRERKRSVNATHDIDELLHFLENSSLCDVLSDIDEMKSVAVDLTAQVQSPGTVARHSIPKRLSTEEAHFEVSVIFRCIDCLVINETAQKTVLPTMCNCDKWHQENLEEKSKASATPAKCKPSLAPLGPEKLRATVQTTRLQFKLLENRLQNLQTKIEENGVGVKPLRMTFSK